MLQQLDSDLELEHYLAQHERKSVLRFITCGSVDDGKSSLIGRLLYETQSLYDDQLSTLVKDSRKHGTQGEQVDFALALDGLQAEREQGITIDVAYRFFSTSRRKFIVADCPGHEQYTRNMATGASTADLAIVLVDARKGLLKQTRRHSFIVSLLGIKQVILAVNKMDAIGYQEAEFLAIESAYLELAKALAITNVRAIPLSALKGDNLIANSKAMPWYSGPTLLEALELAEPNSVKFSSSQPADFLLPVQLVSRPNQDFRGFAGTIAAGSVSVGNLVIVNGNQAKPVRVKSISRGLQPEFYAKNGDSIMLTLDHELDISRGDVISSATNSPVRTQEFSARLLWMSEQPLQPTQALLLKVATQTIAARVLRIAHVIDVDNQSEKPADSLQINDVAVCDFRLDAAICLQTFQANQTLGSFILIDRRSNATLAAGTINALAANRNLHWQNLQVGQAERSKQKHQQPRCIWLTGISGAGKSTLASALDRALTDAGKHVAVLDGDNVRHGLTQHLGFDRRDRGENVRLVAQTARLMVDAGLQVIVSLISPYREDRIAARALFAKDEFVEVFIDTELAVASARDPKGLYAKAQNGQLNQFTGIDAPYEAPLSPEIHLRTDQSSIAESLAQLLKELAE